jgi:hypothetical protein
MLINLVSQVIIAFMGHNKDPGYMVGSEVYSGNSFDLSRAVSKQGNKIVEAIWTSLWCCYSTGKNWFIISSFEIYKVSTIVSFSGSALLQIE